MVPDRAQQSVQTLLHFIFVVFPIRLVNFSGHATSAEHHIRAWGSDFVINLQDVLLIMNTLNGGIYIWTGLLQGLLYVSSRAQGACRERIRLRNPDRHLIVAVMYSLLKYSESYLLRDVVPLHVPSPMMKTGLALSQYTYRVAH